MSTNKMWEIWRPGLKSGSSRHRDGEGEETYWIESPQYMLLVGVNPCDKEIGNDSNNKRSFILL